MILCSLQPESLLKASILAELTGLTVQCGEPADQVSLFDSEERLRADDYRLAELVARYRAETGRGLDWLNQTAGRKLAVMILFNLRHQHADADLILAALADALRLGPASCIFGRTRACLLFRKRSREVSSEVHRLLGLIRFTETSQGDWVAEPKLFHQTADLLLRKFRLRYPAKRLVFLLPEGALGIEQNQFFFLERQELPESLLNPKDEFQALWETYYRSQYIPARKNIRLASRFIPKRYWDWLAEGKILQQEANKK